MLKTITVTLHNRVQTGVDDFNAPIYEDVPEKVSHVLVAPTATTDVIDILNLTGKTATYTLAIPKGDTHDWENKQIDFFGQSWHSFGMVTEGIEENIPLDWNKKVNVERFKTEGDSDV